MANQYRKMQNKLYPKDKKDDKFKEKVGRDYLLVGVLFLTILVTLVGWTTFDNWNRCMYVLLDLSLSLTYIRRHAKLTEVQRVFADRASFISIGFAVAIFIITFIVHYVQ